MQLDPDFDKKVQRVSGRDAAALVDAGVMVLDVRSPEEFSGLGHIPGAKLLPVHLSASAPAMVADAETPVMVCCEHAVRSRFTSRLLAQAGFARVYELAEGMAGWGGARSHDEAPVFGPSSWLVDNADLLPQGGRVLDVACGAGRHALLLAGAGFDVTAVDRDAATLDRLRLQAERLQLRLRTEVVELENDAEGDSAEGDSAEGDSAEGESAEGEGVESRGVEGEGLDRAAAGNELRAGSNPSAVLPADSYDVVLVTRYLHRPLFPMLIRSLAPGGTLIYETFLDRQAERGHPKNPAFLLKPGELATLVQPLEVLRQREGDYDGAFISSIAARRTTP